MKKTTLTSILLFFFFLTFSQNNSGDSYVANQLIVKFKKNNKTGNKRFQRLNNRLGLSNIVLTGNKKQGKTYLLTFSRSHNINSLIDTYQSTNLFKYVEPNYTGNAPNNLIDIAPSEIPGDVALDNQPIQIRFYPNDIKFHPRQWYHYNNGTFAVGTRETSSVDADMDTDFAWSINTGNPDIVVAIIDTGLKWDHPEFSGRLWQNPDEIADNSDTDGNGYKDDLHGWNFYDNNNDISDQKGHGTRVTGVGFATGNNFIGYAGMNWQSKIMVCRITDENGDFDSNGVANAIYYAVDNGAKVINASLGVGIVTSLLADAVKYAYNRNVLIVAGTGNDGVPGIAYPARFDETIAVGGSDANDDRLPNSNYGDQLDFLAPGGSIFTLNHLDNSDYDTLGSGTSYSAAFVTGLISLLLSRHAALSPTRIKNLLINSAEDEVGDPNDTEGWDPYYGYGRINAYKALKAVNNGAVPLGRSSKNSAALYPNPISGNGVLTLKNINNGAYELAIYNIRGEQVDHRKTVSQNKKIALDVTSLTKGIYFIKLMNTTTKEVVIKKVTVE